MKQSLAKSIEIVEKAHQAFHGEEVEFVSIKDYMVAIIRGLKKGHIGHLAIDVYEEEAGLFFEDRSSEILKDDQFARLLTFPNVLVTGHQAFLTDHALRKIAQTTLQSLTEFESSGRCTNCVKLGV